MNKKNAKPPIKQKAKENRVKGDVRIPKKSGQEAKNDKKKITIFLFVILLLTVIIYSSSIKNGFVPWDDNVHIYKNKDITSLDAAHLKKIFSTSDVYLYHPLTILTFAINYKLWGSNPDEKYKIWNGLNPLPFHIENLILHLLNIILVFYLIFLLTKKPELSALVALFFAIHPMHVESVAWATGLKDVLFSFFYLSALIFYIKFKHQVSSIKYQVPKFKFLIYCFILFILSLLSKPAAVTLPVVMILIDYYYGQITNFKSLFSNLLNKIPFLIFSIFFALLPFIGQTGNTTVDISNRFTYFDRFFLLNYSVFFYVIKLIVPYNLSTLHYYPVGTSGNLPPEYYIAPLINLLILIGVFFAGKYKKTLIFGLLFFIITIGLSLQLVPYGQAIVAERYTYIPYIGLLFIIGKYYSDILDNKLSYSKKAKPIFNSILIGAVIIFSVVTYNRNKVWKDGVVLFTDLVNKSPDIFYSYSARGDAKSDLNDYQGALQDYLTSIKLQSNYADSHFSAGRMYYYLNDYKQAINEFTNAIKIKPDFAEAYCNRAAVYFNINDPKSTLEDCSKAIELKPNYADAYINRANAKGVLKDYVGSIEDCDKGIALNPALPEAYRNRGISKVNIGRQEEGCEDFKAAYNLGMKDVIGLINKNCK